jgi:homoserine kinase type II
MQDEPSVDLPRVLAYYDLGELQSQSRDRRGTVNTSFVIELLKGGRLEPFFLRRYRQGIAEEEIQFEHALIGHVSQIGSCPIARVNPTRQGRTYVRLPMDAAGQSSAYFALFDFLPGEDRYTWVGPRCTQGELHSAGALLARFHAAVRGFRPPGRRLESRILDLLPEIAEKWAAAPSLSKGTVFDACVEGCFAELGDAIDGTVAALEAAGARDLPELIIHSDFHPGNLKFIGEAISGLVDFDWSKLDLRAFDVGLALWYFSASWESASDGALRLNDLQAFLSRYQRALGDPHQLPPLTAEELRSLPDLIQAGNLYVLYWTVRDFYARDVDPAEYLIYLEHSLHSARWLLSPGNRRQLEAALAEAGAG